MIAVLCGKSASGKDTLQELLKKNYGFNSIVSATSRPMREGEIEGVNYFFLTREEFINRLNNQEFLEYRTYNTLVDGKSDTWYYGCPKQKLDDNKDYVIILDMNGTRDFVDYYGKDNCFVCYVDCDNKLRKQRAMSRGSFDETEWNRRAEDDEKKFSEDILKGLIDDRITNSGDLTPDGLAKIFVDKFNDKINMMYEKFENEYEER